MRRHSITGALALAGLAVTVTGAQAQSAIKWQATFKAAMAAAQKSNKLVMVDFYTDW